MMVSTASQPAETRNDLRPLEDGDGFASMPRAELDRIARAGVEVVRCLQILAKTNDNVVGDLLRGTDTFHEGDHYPAHKAYDPESHAHYYYHRHREEQDGIQEHGHFHLFLRQKGMPEGIVPAPVPSPPPGGNHPVCHLIAISMDRYGQPLRLFTTNRWVTKETWYRASDVVQMLDRFVVDIARPNWLINRWITAMVRLFRPQIANLIHARDIAIAQWAKAHPDAEVLEDRRLRIATVKTVNLQQHLDQIAKAVKRVRAAAVPSGAPSQAKSGQT